MAIDAPPATVSNPNAQSQRKGVSSAWRPETWRLKAAVSRGALYAFLSISSVIVLLPLVSIFSV